MNLQTEYERRCCEDSDIVDHLPRLHDMACRFAGCQVIELGTRNGNSTAAFLAAADAVDGHVTTIDVNPPQIPAWWMDTGRLTVKVGNDLDPAVLVDLTPADIVFIDTSHHYDQTVAELDTYLPLARRLIVCHDTQLEKPDGTGPDDPPFPVRKAIVEFVDRHGFQWTEHPECYGLGIIEVR